MKLKQKPQDFLVRELLDEGYLKQRGRYRIYRVTKKKLTSMEAAARLADMAGVPAGEVGMAGLKDRQGVTTQYMSVQGGRPVFFKAADLRIEPAGFATEELTSAKSLGNAFEITIRGLRDGERAELERGLEDVRLHGMPNYFGEQRFGNQRHGQGWIARDLARKRHEDALKALVCGRSEHDDARNSRFKSQIEQRWGDWRACREVAGRFGQYISVFQHLMKDAEDFQGAFRFVASKVRLIHLYAWQSHLWNRALAAYFEETTRPTDSIVVPSLEGPLVFARGAMAIDPAMKGVFRLPGTGLDDVDHPHQRDLLALALRKEGLQPGEFRIEGVSGFQLKGEDRAILIHPREMRVKEGENGKVVVRFELPRGAYATLVMARLLPPGPGDPRSSGPRLRDDRRGPRSSARRRGSHDDRGDDRRGGRGRDRRDEDVRPPRRKQPPRVSHPARKHPGGPKA